ncbi:MAG: type II secretion system protein [Sulfurovum sp.]|nr:type II secretion system protein [Sulfurovum sp.]
MKNTTLTPIFRPAFTMIELTFVIVVLGILASLAVPRLENDHSQAGADNILSHIRYTQHLALTDNKHQFNDPQWQRRFWRIMFGPCADKGIFFRIGSDDDNSGGGFTEAESTLSPSDGKVLFLANNADCQNDVTVSKDILLYKNFGITAVTASGGTGGCTGVNIGFDNWGRPHSGFANSTEPNYASIMTIPCTFTFTLSDETTFAITIQPETGYAQIVGQDDS